MPAFSIVPILKALSPILTEANKIPALIALFKNDKHLKAEEKIRQMENALTKSGEVLSSLTQQVEAVAEALEKQVELTQSLKKHLILLRWLCLASLLFAIAALVTAILK
jgi:hypothetical protein